MNSSQKNTLNITSVNRDFKMVQTKPTNRCTVSYILFYITLSHNKRLTVSRILRPQSTSVSDKETAVPLNNQVPSSTIHRVPFNDIELHSFCFRTIRVRSPISVSIYIATFRLFHIHFPRYGYGVLCHVQILCSCSETCIIHHVNPTIL